MSDAGQDQGDRRLLGGAYEVVVDNRNTCVLLAIVSVSYSTAFGRQREDASVFGSPVGASWTAQRTVGNTGELYGGL